MDRSYLIPGNVFSYLFIYYVFYYCDQTSLVLPGIYSFNSVTEFIVCVMKVYRFCYDTEMYFISGFTWIQSLILSVSSLQEKDQTKAYCKSNSRKCNSLGKKKKKKKSFYNFLHASLKEKAHLSGKCFSVLYRK